LSEHTSCLELCAAPLYLRSPDDDDEDDDDDDDDGDDDDEDDDDDDDETKNASEVQPPAGRGFEDSWLEPNLDQRQC